MTTIPDILQPKVTEHGTDAAFNLSFDNVAKPQRNMMMIVNYLIN